MIHCIRCSVKGRVQGVFYRASTQEFATNLGLSGWVRNMPDGTVQVYACGAQDTLAKLQQWLWQGPSGAHVSEVRCDDAKNEGIPGDFDIRF
jgi:acylphosphatase